MKKFLITFFISFIAFVFSSTISFALNGECVEDSSGNIVISVNGRAATQDRNDGSGDIPSPFTYSDGYDDEDMDESDDYGNIAHGSMEWKMMMRQKERLALDMSDLDAAVGGRMIGHMNDDEEDYDESGQNWGSQ